MPSRPRTPNWNAPPSVIRNALLDALAVLAPVDCAGCGSADRALCDSCREQFHPAVTPRALPDGSVVYTALRYEGVVRQAVLAFKEEGRTDVARALAAPLAVAISRALAHAGDRPGSASAPELITVPTSRGAWRRRGYDPVALLCRRAGYTVAGELVRERLTDSQKSLDSREREGNVRGSLRARRRLDGRTFVLVDDVVTTGATLREAARAVREGGGTLAAAAALAFTPRLFAHPPGAEAIR